MHHISLCHGFNVFSARRRRTVSRDSSVCPVSLTISPASSSSVQRARPSGAPEQAVATSSASSLPDSLRAAPGRGPSFNPASRLPSTKRRLVRCTVESLTATQAAIVSSLLPASAANKICARFSLRAACLPPFSIELSSARSAWLNSTRYRKFILVPPIIEARLQVNAVSPEVHVAPRREVPLLPTRMLGLPLAPQPRDHRWRQVRRLLAQQRPERLLEVAHRDPAQVEHRQQRIQAARPPRPAWQKGRAEADALTLRASAAIAQLDPLHRDRANSSLHLALRS